MVETRLSRKQANAIVAALDKGLKQMEERLEEQQIPINEKMEKMDDIMTEMEKIWKIPVDYIELLAIARKIIAQQRGAK